MTGLEDADAEGTEDALVVDVLVTPWPCPEDASRYPTTPTITTAATR